MARRLLVLHWPTLVVKVLLAGGYSVVAIMIQPHPVHVLWLLCVKVMFTVLMFFFDAVAVGVHLRFHPHHFTKQFGKDHGDGKKRNGATSIFVVFLGFIFIALDVARHYLVVSFGQDFEIINIANPFSSDGKSLVWGVRELASMFYWGSTIFLAQSFWAMATRKMARETTVNMTYYEIKVGTSKRSVPVRLSSGQQKGGISLPDWKSQRFELQRDLLR